MKILSLDDIDNLEYWTYSHEKINENFLYRLKNLKYIELSYMLIDIIELSIYLKVVDFIILIELIEDNYPGVIENYLKEMNYTIGINKVFIHRIYHLIKNESIQKTSSFVSIENFLDNFFNVNLLMHEDVGNFQELFKSIENIEKINKEILREYENYILEILPKIDIVNYPPVKVPQIDIEKMNQKIEKIEKNIIYQ